MASSSTTAGNGNIWMRCVICDRNISYRNETIIHQHLDGRNHKANLARVPWWEMPEQIIVPVGDIYGTLSTTIANFPAPIAPPPVRTSASSMNRSPRAPYSNFGPSPPPSMVFHSSTMDYCGDDADGVERFATHQQERPHQLDIFENFHQTLRDGKKANVGPPVFHREQDEREIETMAFAQKLSSIPTDDLPSSVKPTKKITSSDGCAQRHIRGDRFGDRTPYRKQEAPVAYSFSFRTKIRRGAKNRKVENRADEREYVTRLKTLTRGLPFDLFLLDQRINERMQIFDGFKIGVRIMASIDARRQRVDFIVSLIVGLPVLIQFIARRSPHVTAEQFSMLSKFIARPSTPTAEHRDKVQSAIARFKILCEDANGRIKPIKTSKTWVYNNEYGVRHKEIVQRFEPPSYDPNCPDFFTVYPLEEPSVGLKPTGTGYRATAGYPPTIHSGDRSIKHPSTIGQQPPSGHRDIVDQYNRGGNFDRHNRGGNFDRHNRGGNFDRSSMESTFSKRTYQRARDLSGRIVAGDSNRGGMENRGEHRVEENYRSDHHRRRDYNRRSRDRSSDRSRRDRRWSRSRRHRSRSRSRSRHRQRSSDRSSMNRGDRDRDHGYRGNRDRSRDRSDGDRGNQNRNDRWYRGGGGRSETH